MEILKSERNKQAEITTPLQPRILEYGSSGFFGNYSGDYIRMQSRAETIDPVQATRTTTTRDSGQYSGSGFQTSEFGNITNNRLLNTNYSEPMQEIWISPLMAKELQKLQDMISNVPGVVQPIPDVSTGSHTISRFAPPICDAEVPKHFQTPNMKLHDGTTDPEEHIAQYRERMEINPILIGLKEACLCKGFGSTLTGSALKWLLNVPPYSITSFAHLVNLFNNQFSCSRTFERLKSDLYRVTQNQDESLRDYVNRFGRESLGIPNIDTATAVQAFKMGLPKDSQFYEDLVMNPCRNLDEARTRALRFIRLEDDRTIQKRMNPSKQTTTTLTRKQTHHHISLTNPSPTQNLRTTGSTLWKKTRIMMRIILN